MHATGVEAEQAEELSVRRGELVRAAERLARQIAAGEEQTPSDAAPLAEITELRAANLMTAPLPVALGGLGMGTEPGGHLPLLRTLAAIGGADLALGRVFEGHVNALILIASFGTREQLRRAAKDAQAGLLFGVWNTGDGPAMRLEEAAGALRLRGCKGFATGAAFVQRPIVTAECAGPNSGWQMTLPRMESSAAASAVRIDRSSWQPLGMERSESYTIDLTEVPLVADDLIGGSGDFYRDPLFRGGAIRFAAVQAGALLRLAELFANSLGARGRGGDPYQIARMGEVAIAAQEAVLWVERAAAVAEECLWVHVEEKAAHRIIDFANMTRLTIERLATATMPKIIAGVGAHGLLRPARFEGILRDLTMYLRQPNPDGALAEVGQHALSQTSAHPPSSPWSDWLGNAAEEI